MATTEYGGTRRRPQTPAARSAEVGAGSREPAGSGQASAPGLGPNEEEEPEPVAAPTPVRGLMRVLAQGAVRMDPALWPPLLLIAALWCWYAFGPTGFALQMRLGMIVSMSLNLCGTVFALGVARRLAGHPAKRFWGAMAIGGALFALADAIQLAGPAGGPVKAAVARGGGAASVVQALAVLIFVVIFLSYPMGFTSRREAWRFWLDMGAVLLAAGAIELYMVADGFTAHGHITWYDAAIGPVAMLVAIFALAKLILRGITPFPLPTAVAGMACAALGGLAGLIAPLFAGTGQEHWVFWLLPLSSAFFMAAARFGQLRIRQDHGILFRRPLRPYSLLPYASIITLYALLIATLFHQGLSSRQWAVVIAAVTSSGLVAVRQVTAFMDNARLLTQLHRTLAERDALQGELRRLAFHDALTGLANRALFTDRLETTCRQATRDGRAVAVMIIDLDDFKPVNDRYGHAAGDALLAEIATRLSGSLRHSDTVARLGGDEFAVLLHHPLPDSIGTIAERLLRAVTAPCTITGRQVTVGASIGIAINRTGGRTADELLKQADDAMYRAKRQRKSGYEIVELTGRTSR